MGNDTSQKAGFAGLTVAAFESRRAKEIAALISNLGGVPIIAPSVREVPLEEDPLVSGVLVHHHDGVPILREDVRIPELRERGRRTCGPRRGGGLGALWRTVARPSLRRSRSRRPRRLDERNRAVRGLGGGGCEARNGTGPEVA